MTDNQQSGWAKAFKAYDIRGRVPSELNPEMAYRLGRAFAEQLQAKKVVVGRDVRLSSAELAAAVGKGLMEAGCDVLDIGLGGTEMVYFATSHLRADGGIMVTASHNPLDYNGMKLVRRESRPISGDSGLKEIQRLAETNDFAAPQKRGGRLRIPAPPPSAAPPAPAVARRIVTTCR